MSFWKNKKIVAVLMALLVSILVSGLALASVFKLWELQLSDSLYQPSGPREDIVIIAIDDYTLESLGEFSQWSRENYAQLIDVLAQYEPKVVAFDLLFLTPRDTEGDETFAQALQNAPFPILIGQTGTETKTGDKGDIVVEDFASPIFADTPNVSLGSLNALPDEDEVFRKVPLTVTNTTNTEEHVFLPFAVAQKILPNIPSIPIEEQQMLVRFFTTPKIELEADDDWLTFTHLSFADVYNADWGRFNPAKLKDKVIFIGPTADVFKDNFFTPLSSSYKMAGVEVHANALQTILDQAFLRYLSSFEKILLILVLAFGSVFFFMFTRIRWSLLYLVVVPAVYTLLAYPLFRMGVIMDMVHPYVTLIIAFMATYMYRYLTEFKSKMALKGAFSRYVNPSIAEQIAENPESVALGGEKKNITVLFTDIAHFTTISEQLSPESLVAFLNEYLEAMTDVIMAEGGTVDKYEGDAIMAFFGAPVEQPDHALRASRAALGMRKKLLELHAKWQQDPSLPGGEKKPLIDFRCGLSSGDAIVGNIGSSQRLEYTAMGDIVNLGSRLEGANKKYSTNIMMSEETYQKVAQAVVARELDTIRVVGKNKPIKVFELLNFQEELVPEAKTLLDLYHEGIQLYHEQKFAEGLAKFDQILATYPEDGPSKLYRQRCEVMRDFPPKKDWDGVFEMGSK